MVCHANGMNLDEAIAAAKIRRRLPPPELRRFLRERAGLPQQAIADEVGVSRPAVSRWEAGRRTPRGDDLRRYSEILARLTAEATS